MNTPKRVRQTAVSNKTHVCPQSSARPSFRLFYPNRDSPLRNLRALLPIKLTNSDHERVYRWQIRVLNVAIRQFRSTNLVPHKPFREERNDHR